MFKAFKAEIICGKPDFTVKIPTEGKKAAKGKIRIIYSLPSKTVYGKIIKYEFQPMLRAGMTPTHSWHTVFTGRQAA